MKPGDIRYELERFLQQHSADSPFLIPKWSPKLETQVMVKPGINEVETNTWEESGERWSHHRWPYKPGTAPQYTEKKLTYDPTKRLSRVGCTWWNWEDQESVAVSFDIDAADSGHAVGTNQLDEFTLGQVVAKLQTLDYVTLVRSTGGKGVHGYVFFEEGHRPKTVNHGEHTQVALAVIEKIRLDTGMDLIHEKIVDVKGVVLWLWSEASPHNHPGFGLITEAKRELREEEVAGWDEVTAEKKVSVEGGNYAKTDLDDDHVAILTELEDMGFGYRWIDQHQMAHTHTLALKALHEKRKNEGRPLKGNFETTSTGSTEINCYITPRPGGVFKVARFGNSVTEHTSWFVKEDDCWCYFNQDPDPMMVISNYALTSDMASAALSPDQLRDALEFLDVDNFRVPDKKSIQVSYDATSGIVTASCGYSEGDEILPGWTKSGKKVYARIPKKGDNDTRTLNYLDEIDGEFRFVVQPDFNPFGWFHKSNIGWVNHNSSGQLVRVVSQHFGKKAVDEVISMMQSNPWMLDNVPFKGEELADRHWNLNAAGFLCEPAESPGPHPHFDMILEHLGFGLTDAIKQADWTSSWGISNGADYLRYWIASAVKHPFEHLPYLFFFGPQGCGKSIFIETLQMLFPRACGDVASALTGDFNGELRGIVFGYIEEKNLAMKGQAQKAYERIKEWTLAKNIQVHIKGKTPFMQPNTMKFVHMANNINSIRIDRDDTRIVAVDVPRLVDPIPKSIMSEALEKEAPYILRTLLTTNIPPPLERMRVPHINTVAKMEIGEGSMSDVQVFATQFLHPCAGNTIPFEEFQDKFGAYCKNKNISPIGRNAISSELRKMQDLLVIGKMGKNNKVFIANVKFDGDSATGGKKLHQLENGRLG